MSESVSESAKSGEPPAGTGGRGHHAKETSRRR